MREKRGKGFSFINYNICIIFLAICLFVSQVVKTLIYIHTLCVGTGKALSVPSLFTNMISTKILCADLK